MTVAQDLPMVITAAAVTAVERLSPTFLRIELGSPDFADFGAEGPLLDQRIKLVFPTATGELPATDGVDESWFDTWLQLPEEERGHMRTYTAREVRGEGPDTRVVVDFVLHLQPGASGPASRWAAAAKTGDQLVVVGPRVGLPFGGVEYLPPAGTTRVLLAADETGVPAVGGILAGLPADAVGAALLEVPLNADLLDLPAPPGVTVTWLPRDGAPLGSRLVPAVTTYVSVLAAGAAAPHLGPTVVPELDPAELDPADVDPDLWETPSYSSSGAALDGLGGHVAVTLDGLYVWIAGESGVVTTIRRHLVSEQGVDRAQVAFMGYWRRGVAMRS